MTVWTKFHGNPSGRCLLEKFGGATKGRVQGTPICQTEDSGKKKEEMCALGWKAFLISMHNLQEIMNIAFKVEL